MFGYIKTYTPELRVRENEYYRAVYCGLCRSLGKCTGCASRVSLSYDFVFAALVRMALTGTAPAFMKRRCAAHPVRRRSMADPNRELDICACVGILLSYGKTADDIADERGGKRLRAKTLRRAMRGMHRRASARLSDFGRVDERITEGLSELSEIERQRLPSVDIPADCFGRLLGEALSVGLDSPADRIIKVIGFHLGRWLYIIDATDDLADDIKRGRFNPFALLYGDGELDEPRRQSIFNALTAELMEIDAAVALIDRDDKLRDIFGIIDNILHLGMPDAASRVLCRKDGRKERQMDPYKVLGVSRDATDDEVKKAYRDMVRKYHPDKYRDSDLSELANEKMKEVNAAYEQIQKERAGGGSSSAGAGGYSTGNRGPNVDSEGASGNELYRRVRIAINDRRIDEAEQLLNTVAERERGAEWCFLYGTVQMCRGHYVDAQNFYDKACAADPYNQEYASARENLQRHTQRYNGGYYNSTGSECSICNVCSTLMCLDCCCSSCGGCR